MPCFGTTSINRRTTRFDENIFFSWNRPGSFWDAAGHHLPLTILCGLALLLAYSVPIERLPLLECTFLRLTDYPCPFCGITRSFWAIAEGNWSVAMQNAPLAVIIYGLSACGFAWNATALMMRVKLRLGRELRFSPGKGRRFLTAVSILLILNWVYRLSLELK